MLWCSAICSNSLVQVDILPVRTICHKDGYFVVRFGPVDVASYQSFETFQFNGRILFENVRERSRIYLMEVVSNFVRHIAAPHGSI